MTQNFSEKSLAFMEKVKRRNCVRWGLNGCPAIRTYQDIFKDNDEPKQALRRLQNCQDLFLEDTAVVRHPLSLISEHLINILKTD